MKKAKPKLLFRATYIEKREHEFFVEARTRKEGEAIAADIGLSLESATRFFLGNTKNESYLQDFEQVPEDRADKVRPKNMVVFPNSVCLKK